MQTNLTLADLQADPERLLTDTEAAPFRGGTTATLARDRWANTGIPFLKLGRKVAYRAGDILAWVQTRRVETHQQAA
ncbi:MAG: DNA-binding protein [Chromatiales bacterium]|nr:DNA-binding protein [Chromatiales bacterium]